ncbi:helix-turn-helix domain-containing protein [Nitrococcus mobilis]|uniref:DNA-binding protein n=1 Tax=Nitrococcus mobilis Nb-231 TaxID=314278 RepID=A4BN18_9GAMM|nr:hypothetical protein [Nitrococcus mobilis]EAR22617.1 DNA-binding protein [Nitrococcus mobilis Nb-231]
MGSGFDSIKTGLEEAIDHAKGSKTHGRIYRPEPVDVMALRRRLGMTQEQFAARFGVSVASRRRRRRAWRPDPS